MIVTSLQATFNFHVSKSSDHFPTLIKDIYKEEIEKPKTLVLLYRHFSFILLFHTFRLDLRTFHIGNVAYFTYSVILLKVDNFT